MQQKTKNKKKQKQKKKQKKQLMFATDNGREVMITTFTHQIILFKYAKYIA